MKISEVESQVGISVKAIRFYEAEGLIHPKREQNGYRVYREVELEQLRQIKLLRVLGLSVIEIKEVLTEPYLIKEYLEKRCSTIETEIANLKDLKRLCEQFLKEEQPLNHSNSYLDKVETLKGKEGLFMRLKRDGQFKKGIVYFILGLLWPDMLNSVLADDVSKE